MPIVDCRKCRNAKHVRLSDITERYYWVKCVKCGLAIGYPGDGDEAIEAWNEFNALPHREARAKRLYEDITGEPV